MKMHTSILGMLPLLATAGALANPIYSTDFESSASLGPGWSNTLRTSLGGPYTTVLGRFGNRSVDFNLRATAENTAGLDQGGGETGYERFNITINRYEWDQNPVPVYDGGGPGPGGGGNPNTPDLSNIFDLGEAINDDGGQHNGQIAFTPGTYSLTFDLMLFDSWDGNYEGYGPDSFAVDINGQRLFDELLETQWLPNNFRLPDELPELNVYSQSWRDVIYRDITLSFEVQETTDLFSFSFIGTLDQGINDESWGIDNVRVDQVSSRFSGSAPMVPAPSTLALLGAGLGLTTRRRRSAP